MERILVHYLFRLRHEAHKHHNSKPYFLFFLAKGNIANHYQYKAGHNNAPKEHS